jgi:hypothetical protein
MVSTSGISDTHVQQVYREFYEFYNGDDPQTYGVQWNGELWALLFLVVIAGTTAVLIRQYRTHSTTLYPLERFGPLTERASGLGIAFIVILIGQIAWALYITITHITIGQHY